MRRMRELFRRQQPEESPCPRCGVPAPVGTIECAACGWDIRDAYHDPLKEPHQTAVADDRDAR